MFLILAIFLCQSTATRSQTVSLKSLQDKPGVEFMQFDQDMLKTMFKAANPKADLDKLLKDIQSFTPVLIDKYDDNGKKTRGHRRTCKQAQNILKEIKPQGFHEVVDAQNKDKEDSYHTKVYQKDISSKKQEDLIYLEDDEGLCIVSIIGKLSTEEAKEMIKIKIE